MSKIRIKNFGPIKDGFRDENGNEWMDIKKVTAFIGNQGSGKSTVAKLISTFSWIEKALNRGDLTISSGNDILKLIAWQRLESYLKENTEIEYLGNRYSISYKPTKDLPWPIVKLIIGNKNYEVPKIMYVPAERNFLSTIKDAFDVSGLPGPLAIFAEELKRSQIELKEGNIDLPFLGITYEYDKREDLSYVVGGGYKINMLEASSGLQSIIPLYLVSHNLSTQILEENDPSNARLNANRSVRRDREISTIMLDRKLSSHEKSQKADEIYAKYHNKCFINIVEEPEQNLFPESQKEILESLSKFNSHKGNKLIFTTHSPYIINFLTIAIQGNSLLNKIEAAKRDDLKERLNAIIPIESCIDANDAVIYELDKKGNIVRLKDYAGIPSDKNYLNDSLAQCNLLFDSLLEIEEDL